MKVSTILSLILLGSSLTLGSNAYAKGGVAPVPGVPAAGGGGGGGGGGTVKPPAKNLVAPVFTPTMPLPAFTVNPLLIHGFDAVGISHNATTDGCGGTVTVDSKNITIPCGLIVQMPANTLTWAAFVNGGISSNLEINLTGNSVNGTYIAALAYVSQQSLHGGSGFITGIDYSTGNITVDGATTLQINDPNGRFGRAQSPDPRFSVDDANPTIHAGTGYPMCVPRTLTDPTIAGNPDDPLCPQKNRPLAAGGCRNFGASGFAPPVSGELTPPAFGQTYCSQYVMKAVPGAVVYPTPAASLPINTRSDSDADPRQQVPFEVGDFIAYSGTIMSNGLVSVHTIEANVGIFTQPGTQPSYLAIGGFGIGTADPAPAVTGVGQEATNRMFLEAATTDFRTPVDIYLVDDAPAPGVVRQRWVTPWEMTGECPPANGLLGLAGTAPLAASCGGITGGISTSLTGPQAQRDRIRAVKSPLGLLNRPSRTVRVIARSLCLPANPINDGFGNPALGVVDDCLAKASVEKDTTHPTGNLVANGLVAGQYSAPVFEYIFPENVKQGDVIIPHDTWQLPFLVNGESGAPALNPTPW